MKVSPEWRCPFTRGNKYKDYRDILIFWDQSLCPLNGGVPWIEVSRRRGSTVSNNLVQFASGPTYMYYLHQVLNLKKQVQQKEQALIEKEKKVTKGF